MTGIIIYNMIFRLLKWMRDIVGRAPYIEATDGTIPAPQLQVRFNIRSAADSSIRTLVEVHCLNLKTAEILYSEFLEDNVICT